MHFRTIHPPLISPFHFDQRSPVFSIGSCFAKNISEKLNRLKFKTLCNPFGVNYNPLSILNTITAIQQGKKFGKADLFNQDDRWFSWAHDSHFQASDPKVLYRLLNETSAAGASFLSFTGIWLVTYGTAWIYEKKDDGKLVANCHKAPASHFKRRRLSVDEVARATQKIIELARAQNPDIKIIFSISPVRHLKDGFHGNQLSKSTLALGLEQALANDPAIYFPSYELLLDDLRDYRFYNRDMTHPSAQAIDYIWAFFKDSFFSTDTRRVNQEIEKLLQAAGHRPIAPGSEAHRQFIAQTLQRMDDFCNHFPFIDLSDERARLQANLKK